MNRISLVVIIFILLNKGIINAQTQFKFIPDSLNVNVNQTATFSFPDCPYRLWQTYPYSVEYSIDMGKTWQPSSQFNGTITCDGSNNLIVNGNANQLVWVREIGWICSIAPSAVKDTINAIIQIGPLLPQQINESIKGNVISPQGYKIKNTSIIATDTNKIFSTFTDINGQFVDSLLSGNNYNIKPYKNNDIIKTNGVTALDIAIIQSHILGKNKLNSPYKLIAADVNGDGKITALDLVYLKRLILGIDTTFTNTVTKENRLWAFVDSSYKFADSTNPFPFKDSISYTNLNANQSNQTFIGIKLGDVNWDWNPALAKMPSPVFVRPKRLSIIQ